MPGVKPGARDGKTGGPASPTGGKTSLDGVCSMLHGPRKSSENLPVKRKQWFKQKPIRLSTSLSIPLNSFALR